MKGLDYAKKSIYSSSRCSAGFLVHLVDRSCSWYLVTLYSIRRFLHWFSLDLGLPLLCQTLTNSSTISIAGLTEDRFFPWAHTVSSFLYLARAYLDSGLLTFTIPAASRLSGVTIIGQNHTAAEVRISPLGIESTHSIGFLTSSLLATYHRAVKIFGR